MNTYAKFCPNVFLAKCTERHNRGEEIQVQTKYGKENPSIVFNLIFERDGVCYYAIGRSDGFNAQKFAEKKAERLINASANAEKKSDQYWEASNEGRDFLALGEPIKIGHHSEKRHRALIERNHNRMNKSVELQKVAETYQNRAEYWENRKDIVNLSMPESVEYFEYEVEKSKMYHEGLKNGTIEKSHSFSLTYAKKDLNENEKKLALAKRLWS